MLIEDLLLCAFVAVVLAVLGRPVFKLYRRLNPPEVDPVEAAREHLDKVRKEAEAARLNKEADQIVEEMYEEELEEAAVQKERLK